MKSLRSEINITPLVDIVLVLLIIFMVLTPLLQSGYQLAFPVPSTHGVPNLTSIRVRLNDSNEIYVNDSKVESTQIPKIIFGRSVLFEAADSVNYGAVLEVIDLIHRAQPNQIAIRTHT